MRNDIQQSSFSKSVNRNGMILIKALVADVKVAAPLIVYEGLEMQILFSWYCKGLSVFNCVQ